jgi:large subunit ribosomal protein L3
MTGLFSPEGRYVPVTVIQTGPCVVTQVKTTTTDGYDAVQLGFGQKKAERVNKPLSGHYAKSGNQRFEIIREFAVDNPEEYEVGQTITADLFGVGDFVDITGTTKGRGFSGVMKRHGFGGGRMTHGSHSKRIPGSVGCSAWPGKIIRGKKMPGQYGGATQTVRNLEIVDIRPEDNLVLVKGTVPGSKSGWVKINKIKF